MKQIQYYLCHITKYLVDFLCVMYHRGSSLSQHYVSIQLCCFGIIDEFLLFVYITMNDMACFRMTKSSVQIYFVCRLCVYLVSVKLTAFGSYLPFKRILLIEIEAVILNCGILSHVGILNSTKARRSRLLHLALWQWNYPWCNMDVFFKSSKLYLICFVMAKLF